MVAVAICLVLVGCDDGGGGDPDAGPGDATVECVSGDSCDDGDPCTQADTCVDGACVGAVSSCDDGLPCTEDLCSAAGATEGCPPGATLEGGVCLAAIQTDEPRGRDVAHEACVTWGGELVSIADGGSNAGVRALADTACGAGAEVWLGLGDETEEGAYVWSTGEPVTYTGWAEGQPSDPSGDADGVVMLGDGTWATARTAACVVCQTSQLPYSCSNLMLEPSSPAAAAERCNDVDDDCDGVADDGGDELCEDDNPCTIDTCVADQGCSNVPDEILCDDQIDCTADSCDAVLGCVHTPVATVCDDGIVCTVDSCDPTSGCVATPQDVACDDGQACTTDVCSPGAGCGYTADDSVCGDAFDCTLDSCQPFLGCVATADSSRCDDSNPCIDETCVAGAGCVETFTTAPCEDTDACTAAAVCAQGACVPAEPLVCDDSTPCTADACDPAVGCVAPLTTVCDYPGPVAGYYEGPFHIYGQFASIVGTVHWDCVGTARAVADASRTPDIEAPGEAFCRYYLQGNPQPLFNFSNVLAGRTTGTIDGNQVDTLITVGGVVLPARGTIVVDVDNVPTALTGSHVGTTATDPLIDVVITDSQLRIWAKLGSADTSSYTAVTTLVRVPIDGTCCGPAGCEPSMDWACYQKGWTFSARNAGECCSGAACAILTEPECDTLGGLFVPSDWGACCGGPQPCAEMAGVLCDLVGGSHQGKLSCDDGNTDSFADACGPPATYGYDVPAVASQLGTTLTVGVGGVADLTMESTSWTRVGNTYHSGPGVTVQTPLGAIPLGAAATISVNLDAPLTILGQSTVAPVFALPDLSSLGITASGVTFTYGYDFGHRIRAAGVEGPFADARPYLFASANDGLEAGVGGISLGLEDNNEATVAIDWTDPAYLVHVGGSAVGNGTGGLVRSVGFGLSRNGNLTWRSALDIYDGDRFAPAIRTGHIWRSGAFSLIPIPGLPANLVLDGDLIVDVGGATTLIDEIATSLVAGDTTALEAALGDPAAVNDVLANLALAGNADSLNVSVDHLDLAIGRASFAIDGSRFSFTGEGFTPLANVAENGGPELLETLSALTIQQSGKSWGYIDGDDWLFGAEVDLVAGPFALTDVRLLIDPDGVRIEGGSFGFDFDAFLDQLGNLMDCTFSASGAACSVAGIPVASFTGQLDDAGFRLSGSMGVPVLGQVEFAAIVESSGGFLFRGSASAGIPGFQTGAVSVVLTDSSFGVSTAWSQMAQTVQLDGLIEYDGDFLLSGYGAIRVAGFTMSSVKVTLSSATGLRAEGNMNLLTQQIRGVLTVAEDLGTWTFEGSGALAPYGYQLAEVTVSATTATEGAGVFIRGRVGIATATATLEGYITPSTFSISGTADLSIQGYLLSSATVTLSSSGLYVSGRVNIQAAQLAITGRVETNGDFLLQSSAAVNVPVAGLSFSVDAALRKVGWSVSLSGNASCGFAGMTFTGGYRLGTTGEFNFWAANYTARDFGRLDVEMNVFLSISNSAFAAAFGGRGCVDYWLGDKCVGIGGSMDASGTFCVNVPILGSVCRTL